MRATRLPNRTAAPLAATQLTYPSACVDTDAQETLRQIVLFQLTAGRALELLWQNVLQSVLSEPISRLVEFMLLSRSNPGLVGPLGTVYTLEAGARANNRPLVTAVPA